MRTSRARTVAFVSADPVLTERIRASLRRGPFRFRAAGPGDLDPGDDLLVVPASLLASFDPAAAGVPVVAYGPPASLRSAFLLGCADYLKDPWVPEELHLRALRLLGRAPAAHSFPWGDLVLEGGALCGPRGSVALGAGEALMLRLLLSRRGEAVPRDALRAVASGRPLSRGSRLVDVRMSGLRRKLAAVLPPGASAGFLRCLRREGYLIP